MKLTLKALRANKGWTLDTAAKKIKVNKRTLWSWENNKTFPNQKYIPIIENVYGFKYDDIIFLK